MDRLSRPSTRSIAILTYNNKIGDMINDMVHKELTYNNKIGENDTSLLENDIKMSYIDIVHEQLINININRKMIHLR